MGKYDADPVKRKDTPNANKKAPTAQQLASRTKALRTQRIAIISGCVAAFLILVIVIICLLVNAGNADDGKILPNVYAAGINLGGMSKEEAGSALRLATNKSLLKNPMVVILPDGVLEFYPEDTHVSIDVDAVVEAAYSYGRTGSKKTQEATRERSKKSVYTIALLPYMKDLDLEYIYSTVEDFCSDHGSALSSAVTVSGERPTYDPDYPSSAVKHQKMTIVTGAPYYKLTADELYAQVLDAYSLNTVEFTYQTDTNTRPETLSAEKIFNEFCVLPQNATKDPATYEITPEVYGYGFDIDEVQHRIDIASFGDTIEIELKFLYPDITAKDLKDGVFEDKLAEFTTTGQTADSLSNNLKASCQALDGVISFNAVVGRPTMQNGYKEYKDVMGGGIDQTASALYYCALMADLKIVERTNNDYVVDYIEKGLDVCIEWDKHDLKFVNTTDAPIRIKASAKDNRVTVRLEGTDKRNYKVNIITKVLKTYEPDTIYQKMDKNNIYGYTHGTVLVEGLTGYNIQVSVERIHKQTELLISTDEIDTSTYDKRDEKVVSIQDD